MNTVMIFDDILNYNTYSHGNLVVTMFPSILHAMQNTFPHISYSDKLYKQYCNFIIVKHCIKE